MRDRQSASLVSQQDHPNRSTENKSKGFIFFLQKRIATKEWRMRVIPSGACFGEKSTLKGLNASRTPF